MADTLKKSTTKLRNLASGAPIQDAETVQVEQTEQKATTNKSRPEGETLIGASFPYVVKASLHSLLADPRNYGRTTKDLLAEALNDLFAKYGQPETAKVEGKNANQRKRNG